MANTYKALSTVTVGAGGAATINFTNIPQTYTDLAIKLSLRTDVAGVASTPLISINGSTSNISSLYVEGNGATTSSGYGASSRWVGLENRSTSTSNTFANNDIYIPNYTRTDIAKAISADSASENNATTSYTWITNLAYSSSTAITSITITADNGNYVQYSTATLYGVFNADVSSAPATPTIGTATATSGTTATVAFTGVSNAASYTATSTPGSITATGTTSPITVTGLTSDTAYTFTVKSNNPFGSSANSAASNSVTPSAGQFDSLATVTVGAGGVSSISFTSIPQTYKHLQIRSIHKHDSGGSYGEITLNSGNFVRRHYAYGDGSGVVGGTDTANAMFAGSSTYWSGTICDLLDYTNTNKNRTYKVVNGADNNGSGIVHVFSGLDTTTTATNSVTITATGGGMFSQYSHFALYGIKAG